MRCPKCSYISFDRVERCGKCGRDVTAAAAQLRGSMVNVAPPMFLGGLLREAARAAEAEPETVELVEEELDLGSLGDVGEEVAGMAAGAEEPAAEAVGAEEMAPALPGLSDIDVSDLVPPGEETVAIEMPMEEENEGIAMPELPPAAATSGGELFANLNLTGGESRGESDAGAAAESDNVLDLTDLLSGASEEEENAAEAGGGEDDDFFLSLGGGDLSLSLESSESEATTGEAAASPTPEAAAPPDIPDLGLTLESDDEDEKPAS